MPGTGNFLAEVVEIGDYEVRNIAYLQRIRLSVDGQFSKNQSVLFFSDT